MPKKRHKSPAARGNETILLVEDEPLTLALTARVLENLGYTVLSASTPEEAIRLANSNIGKIPLLCTDVVMPEMSGLDLVKTLRLSFPELKCLFMSGYAASVISHHEVLDEGMRFIQKPFLITDLSAKVRETLDSK